MTYDDRQAQPFWQPQPAQPESAPRRRRWPYRLAIVLLVLAGLFTAADRIGVGIAESQIASRVQKTQNLASKPSVSIDGFPFLTQLIGMKFSKVSLDARNVMRNGVRVTDLSAVLRGVKPTSGFKTATVDHLDGTAYFDWTDLQAAASTQGRDVTVSDGGDGLLRVSGKIPFHGEQVPLTVLSQLTLSAGNVIMVKAVKVESVLPLPGLAAQVVQNQLDYRIPVGSLPMDMTLHDFVVSADGVRISASAQNVTLTGSGVQMIAPTT